jgi:UDP-N-acetylmuramate dehydrogenase
MASGETAAARERVPLAPYTTLRLGGPARRLVEAGSEAEVVAAVRAADTAGEPLLVLGGGSNLVVADEGFPGTVVRVATTGTRVSAGGQQGNGSQPVELVVAAGEDWDTVVAGCVAGGLAGLECLSGIPGRTGATPIQNVGAYGQEVAERISSVRVYDRERGGITELTGPDCGFGYRTSAFKRSLQAPAGAATAHAGPGGQPKPGPVTGRFVVLDVRFRLVRDRLSMPVRYAELARALGTGAEGRAPLADVRAAVLELRRGKGMVLDPDDPDTRSVGSFFVNPVLDAGQYAALERAAQARAGPGVRIPHYPAGRSAGDDGRAGGELVKVSAAWLIEQAGFGKGYRGAAGQAAGNGARISSKHTLALVNPGTATTASLLALAREVRRGVRETFGVDLISEPVLVGACL